jgi:kynurenine 3-monooxygenase
MSKQKTVIVGAGPVGALAALYAAGRGHEVEVYELRGGMSRFPYFQPLFLNELEWEIRPVEHHSDR